MISLRSLRQLHRQLTDVSEARDSRSWPRSGPTALGDSPPSRPPPYVVNDGEPHYDALMAWEASPPPDRVTGLVEAVLSAVAARESLRAIDGELPDQPLCTTLDRRSDCKSVPSELRHVAFVLDGETWVAELASQLRGVQDTSPSRISSSQIPLAPLCTLASALADPAASSLLTPLAASPHVPFVTVCLDGEKPELVRHTHRHGWLGERGPWLGVGRAGQIRAISTAHFAVDGYGHAWLTAGIAHRTAELFARHGAAMCAAVLAAHPALAARLRGPDPGQTIHPCRLVDRPEPFGLAWRVLPAGGPALRAIPLAYRFAQILARIAPQPGLLASRSPSIRVPVAPGDKRDPLRVRRRVNAALVAVRYHDGTPEPFEAFAARVATTFAAEATGSGMLATLGRATAALPVPLRWKRRVIGGLSTGSRNRWLGDLPATLGGRGSLSVIRLREWTSPPLIAAGSPAIVVTLVEDGERAMMTASGSGIAGGTAAAALLDEMLAP
jgi:hypothetical protein